MGRAALKGARILSLMVLACALVSCAPRGAAAPLTTGTIRILEPKDGAKIEGQDIGTFVTLKVSISRFTLQKPLSGKKPNAGHIHYWIDNASDPNLIPAIADTTFRLFVPAGKHKIRAELVQDDHGSFADGYVGKRVNFTSDPKYFAPRPTMDTITIFVMR